MKRLISSLMSLAVLSMLPACAATGEDPDEVAKSSKPGVVAVQGDIWEWVAPQGGDGWEWVAPQGGVDPGHPVPPASTKEVATTNNYYTDGNQFTNGKQNLEPGHAATQDGNPGDTWEW